MRGPSAPRSLCQFSDYPHAVATLERLKLREYLEELVERPPMAEILAGGQD